MILTILIVAGLVLGSFVNALVWRLHEQEAGKDSKDLSITGGRSMCPHCRHPLVARDLVPVLSWLSLGGKCRYCGQPISVQYPIVELTTAGLFVASYIWWPLPFNHNQTVIFIIWLPILTGLIALAVYDLKWFLLPNRIIYPLAGLAVIQALIAASAARHPFQALLSAVAAVIIGGGIFYVLFQASKGRWIGGGDVKLGWLLGLIVATPAKAVLFIFFGSVLGTLASLPLMAKGRVKRTSVIPFGPFLIAGAIVTVLFGADLLHWYQHTFLSL